LDENEVLSGFLDELVSKISNDGDTVSMNTLQLRTRDVGIQAFLKQTLSEVVF
jgi:hypothetical protein